MREQSIRPAAYPRQQHPLDPRSHRANSFFSFSFAFLKQNHTPAGREPWPRLGRTNRDVRVERETASRADRPKLSCCCLLVHLQLPPCTSVRFGSVGTRSMPCAYVSRLDKNARDACRDRTTPLYTSAGQDEPASLTYRGVAIVASNSIHSRACTLEKQEESWVSINDR